MIQNEGTLKEELLQQFEQAHEKLTSTTIAGVVQGLTVEQIGELEEQVIRALKRWVDEGTIGMQEAGAVITELAMLLLKHHRLLEAAELLIRYGWLGINQGYIPHLVQIVTRIPGQMEQASLTHVKKGLSIHRDV